MARRRQIRELRDQLALPEESEGAAEEAPATTTMAIELRNRISDLEQSLCEERRALQECEERCRELEARYNELL